MRSFGESFGEGFWPRLTDFSTFALIFGEAFLVKDSRFFAIRESIRLWDWHILGACGEFGRVDPLEINSQCKDAPTKWSLTTLFGSGAFSDSWATLWEHWKSVRSFHCWMSPREQRKKRWWRRFLRFWPCREGSGEGTWSAEHPPGQDPTTIFDHFFVQQRASARPLSVR